jgi:putative ABC transport system permease protein
MILRFALRELGRLPRFQVLLSLVLITLAVTAVSGIQLFQSQVESVLRSEGRETLRGDFELNSAFEIPGATLDLVQKQFPHFKTTRSVEFLGMARIPETGFSHLVNVVAFSEGFPMVGRFLESSAGQVSTPSPGEAAPKEPTPLKPGQLWVAREWQNLSASESQAVSTGESRLELGTASFKVAAVIAKEPGISAGFFSLGPKIWMRLEDLESTGLAQTGSRIRYRVQFAAPSAQESQAIEKETIEALLPKDSTVRVQTHLDSNRQLDRFYSRLGLALGAFSILILLLAGVALSYTIQSLQAGRSRSVAILSCLGVSNSRLLKISLVQLTALGILGTTLGLLGGRSLSLLIPRVLSDPSLTSLGGLSISGIAAGLMSGVGLVLGFGLWSLLPLRHLKPNALIAGGGVQLKNFSWAEWTLASAIAVLLFLSAWLLTRDWQLAAWITFPLIGAALLIFGLGYSGIRLTAKLLELPINRLSIRKRYAIREFFREPLSQALLISVLGFGSLLWFLVEFTQGAIEKEFSPATVDSKPALFVVDIPSDQNGVAQAVFQKNGFASPTFAKLFPATLKKIRGESLSDADGDTRIRREFRLSERSQLSEGEMIVSGVPLSEIPLSPFESGQPLAASVEVEWAKSAGVSVGDLLEFEISGVMISVKVANTRKVKWTTFVPNFFVILQDGALPDAPMTWIASSGPRDPGAQKQAALRALAQQVPTASTIDIEEATLKLLGVTDRIRNLILLIAAFTVVLGALILSITTLESVQKRAQDFGMLRTIGAPESWISQMIQVEPLIRVLGVTALGAFGAWFAFSFWIGPRFEFDRPDFLSPRLLLMMLAQIVWTAIIGAWAARSRPKGALIGR